MKQITVCMLAIACTLLFACSKSSNSTSSIDTRPLKAVLNATVSGMVITITADKSEGDVCAYGFSAYPVDSTINAQLTYITSNAQKGQANSTGTGYVSGTLKYIPLSASVNKKTDYTVALEVLDKDKKSSWAYTTVTVK